MSGEMWARGGRGGGGFSVPAGLGGSGGEEGSSILLTLRDDMPERPAILEGSVAVETGFGLPAMATTGVGLTIFGLTCFCDPGSWSKL
jgi:hypothetical protein